MKILLKMTLELRDILLDAILWLLGVFAVCIFGIWFLTGFGLTLLFEENAMSWYHWVIVVFDSIIFTFYLYFRASER